MLKGTNQSLYEFSDHHLSALAAAAAAEDEAAMIYGSDEFRMYAYKIKRCPRMRSHDWTECPYAHRGEKAQRRDPRRHDYAAVVCPAFRSGASCARGDACEFAHGVFEYWLHPSRYRTRACNSGRLCQRKVCFFAHSPDQLRPETKPPKRHHHHHPHHYAYRPRAAAAAADAAAPATSPSPTSSLSSPSSSSSGLMKSVAKTLHGHDRDDHRGYDCFDKFADFLNSLRALKISGGESEDDGGDDNYHGGDLDLPHVEWISELVK